MFQFIERVTSLPSPSCCGGNGFSTSIAKNSHQCHRIHNFGTQRNYYYMKGWSLFSNKNRKTFRSDVFNVHSNSTEKRKQKDGKLSACGCAFFVKLIYRIPRPLCDDDISWWQIDMGAHSRTRNHALCAIQNQIKINGKRFSMDITHATPQLNQNSMSHSVLVSVFLVSLSPSSQLSALGSHKPSNASLYQWKLEDKTMSDIHFILLFK